MPHIELPSPSLRTSTEPWCAFTFQTGSKHYLPIPPPEEPDPGFFFTLHSRHTRRRLGALTPGRLSRLLWHSCKVKRAMPPSSGIRWQHRTAPSAGGLHCIEVLVIDGGLVRIYEPIGHSVQMLEINGAAFSELLRAATSIVDLSSGTLIWFAADFDLMMSKYEHGESLVWRDAGSLCATMCLVAEALELGCRPIGITGEPHVSAMLNSDGRILGVGGMLVGSNLED